MALRRNTPPTPPPPPQRNTSEITSIESKIQAVTARSDAVKARRGKLKADVAAAKERQSGAQNVGDMKSSSADTKRNGSIAATGLGTVLIAVGTALMAGTAGLAFAGAVALVTAGVASTSAGQVLMMEANADMNEATQSFAEARNQGIISDQQAAAASREVQVAGLYANQKALLEETLETFKRENPGQYEAMSPQEQKQFKEDMFEDIQEGMVLASQAMRDRDPTTKQPIFTMAGDNGQDEFFVKNNDGSFSQVQVKLDANGEPERGQHGELKGIDSSQPSSPVAPGSATELALMTTDSYVTSLTAMIQGDASQGFPPLEKYTEENGLASSVPFDLNSPEDMAYLFQTTVAASEGEPPLRYYRNDDGVLGFQKWDWDNDTELGRFVPLSELTTDATEAQAAFAELGLNTGGSRSNYLSSLGNSQNSTQNFTSNLPSQYSNALQGVTGDVFNQYGGGPSGGSSQSSNASGSSQNAGNNRDDDNTTTFI